MVVNKRKWMTFIYDNEDENHKVMSSHDVNTEQILTKVQRRTKGARTKRDLLIYDKGIVLQYWWLVSIHSGDDGDNVTL